VVEQIAGSAGQRSEGLVFGGYVADRRDNLDAMVQLKAQWR
jgi:hypothetical protein